MRGLEGSGRCARERRIFLVEQSYAGEKNNRHDHHHDLADRKSMGSDMLPIFTLTGAIRLSEAIMRAGVAVGCVQEITICHIVHSFSRMKMSRPRKSGTPDCGRQKLPIA